VSRLGRQASRLAQGARFHVLLVRFLTARPDAQDKQAQENFKTEIRARLLATGRIRGVPRGGHRRSPPDHLGPLLTGIPPGFIPAPEFDMPGVAGPGPHSAGSYDTDYGFNPYAGSFHHHPGAAAYGETGLIPSPFGNAAPHACAACTFLT
jgi:hypothetical protein